MVSFNSMTQEQTQTLELLDLDDYEAYKISAAIFHHLGIKGELRNRCCFDIVRGEGPFLIIQLEDGNTYIVCLKLIHGIIWQCTSIGHTNLLPNYFWFSGGILDTSKLTNIGDLSKAKSLSFFVKYDTETHKKVIQI